MNNLDSDPDRPSHHPKTLLALAGIGSFVAAEFAIAGLEVLKPEAVTQIRIAVALMVGIIVPKIMERIANQAWPLQK